MNAATGPRGAAPPPESIGAVSTPRRWAILQHVPHEGPGVVADLLGASGVAVEVVRLDQGVAVPAVDSLEGLVVLGGPMGVHDGGVHGWIEPERALLADAVARGIPVLGICLGAQQLAATLGADISSGPFEEVGPGRVHLTPEGRRDPVFGPEYGGLASTTIPCVHWHRDTFTIPPGAVHLAATSLFPHQAFRYGRSAYGLQFHVEVDRVLAAQWRPLLPEGTVIDERTVAEIESVGRRILERFATLASSALAAPPGGPR